MSIFRKRDKSGSNDVPEEQVGQPGMERDASVPDQAEGSEPFSVEDVPYTSGDILSDETAERTGDGISEQSGGDAASDTENADTVLLRSDEEAHRNTEYKVPGKFRQTLTFAGIELRRIAKTKRLMTILILGAIMILLMRVEFISNRIKLYLYILSAALHAPFMAAGWGVGMEGYISVCLCLLPFFGAYYCCSVSSHSVPDEFRERTAFVHCALPVSKSSMYLGKFIASFTVIVFLVATGFGFSILCAHLQYPDEDLMPGYLLSGMATALLASFALCSMIYSMSAGKTKGSTFRGFMLIILSVPLLLIIPSAVSPLVPSASSALDCLGLITAYLPMSGFDLALFQIGSDGFALSAKGLCVAFSHSDMPIPFDYPINEVSVPIAYAVYIAWGILFMFLGIRKMNRREL